MRADDLMKALVLVPADTDVFGAEGSGGYGEIFARCPDGAFLLLDDQSGRPTDDYSTLMNSAPVKLSP